MTLTADQPNAVSYWSDIANRTVLATTTVSTPPEEERPAFFHSPATVHLAIYDAAVAIEGRDKPIVVKPKAAAVRPPPS